MAKTIDVPELGRRKALPTVVDDSAMTHETVFASGGRRAYRTVSLAESPAVWPPAFMVSLSV